WALRGPANFRTSRASSLQNSTSKQKRNVRVSEKADSDPRRIPSVAFVLEHLLDLLSQVRLILMPVRTPTTTTTTTTTTPAGNTADRPTRPSLFRVEAARPEA